MSQAATPQAATPQKRKAGTTAPDGITKEKQAKLEPVYGLLTRVETVDQGDYFCIDREKLVPLVVDPQEITMDSVYRRFIGRKNVVVGTAIAAKMYCVAAYDDSNWKEYAMANTSKKTCTKYPYILIDDPSVVARLNGTTWVVAR